MPHKKKMVPNIIAICGMKRHGKDTIADYLCQHFGYHKVCIATPLKESVKVMFGFTDEQVNGHLKDIIDERWNIEPRKALQFIGTELMQYQIQHLLPTIGRTFWIQTLIERHILNNNNHSDAPLVIPDLRFKHEYEILAKHGAVFWRVERTNLLEEDAHVSEHEYLTIPVSHVFKNETKDGLYQAVYTHLKNINQN